MNYWRKTHPIWTMGDLPIHRYQSEHLNLPVGVELNPSVVQDLLRQTGLFEKISEILSPIRIKEESEILPAVKDIHFLILALTFPEPLKSALSEAWAHLAPALQGVHCVSEMADPEMRAHGYQNPEEKVSNQPEALFQAVIRGVMAFYHPQSVAYRFRNGLSHDAGQLTFRFHQFFPKHYPHGETYSAHPQTGYRNSIWTEVKGQTYEWSKEALRRNKSAVVDAHLSSLKGYILPHEDLNALAQMVMDIEQCHHQPFKISWRLTLDENKNQKLWLHNVEPFSPPEPPVYEALPDLPFVPLLSCSDPTRAHEIAHLPHQGIGLCRLEHIIKNQINFHPEALVAYPKVPIYLKKQIEAQTGDTFARPLDFYAHKLALAIARLAMAIYPRRMLVRFSDFKSSEYAQLQGGNLHEKTEANPMLGLRGVSRYLSNPFQASWFIECQTISHVRTAMGWDNVDVLVPFVRTIHEAELLLEALKTQNLERGKDGLRIFMMCEIPSNALLAEQFLNLFDGFSIGSGDMTQLTLGFDNETGDYPYSIGNEMDLACKVMYSLAIQAGKKLNKPVGICGQAPSTNLDFTRWLIGQGIDSIAFSPEALLEKIQELSATKLK